MFISFYTIILLVLFFPDFTLNSSDKDDEVWRVAKKEFARRTQEYLRTNPMSNELRSFIEDLKQTKRRKRQDHRNMYAIKDGEVVPLEAIEESLNTLSDLGENFTVVPLIIPIPLENKVTFKGYSGTQDIDSDANEEWTSSSRPILGRGKVLHMAKQKNDAAEETVAGDLIDDKLKSTTQSPELNKVLEDVQSLINSQKKGKQSAGALCNVSGYWDSESGGVTFHIRSVNGEADIQMQPREPPSDDGFIPLEKWNVTARIPFQQAAQVIVTLTASKRRKIAIFLGECRICDGSETISGDWLIARPSSGCKDQKAAHSFLADVFRKNNVEALRQAHIKQLSNLTSAATAATGA